MKQLMKADEAVDEPRPRSRLGSLSSLLVSLLLLHPSSHLLHRHTMTALPRALVIGRHRKGGITMMSRLVEQIQVVGITDALLPFDAKLLATMLRTFHPPIELVSLGGAFEQEDASQARRVWEEYREEVECSPEVYGEVGKGKTGFVWTSAAEITKVGEELGVEGYDAVVEALVKNLRDFNSAT